MLGPVDPPFGLSIGIATHPPHGGDGVEELIRRADAAMYEVKRAGRGHWRVAHGKDEGRDSGRAFPWDDAQ
jgi:GGDEF domain-containing protein